MSENCQESTDPRKAEVGENSHVNLAVYHDPSSVQEMTSKSKFKMEVAKCLPPWLETGSQRSDGNAGLILVFQKVPSGVSGSFHERVPCL